MELSLHSRALPIASLNHESVQSNQTAFHSLCDDEQEERVMAQDLQNKSNKIYANRNVYGNQRKKAQG